MPYCKLCLVLERSPINYFFLTFKLSRNNVRKVPETKLFYYNDNKIYMMSLKLNEILFLRVMTARIHKVQKLLN